MATMVGDVQYSQVMGHLPTPVRIPVLCISLQQGILWPRLLPLQPVLQLPQRRGRGHPAAKPAAIAAVDHDVKGRGVVEVHLYSKKVKQLHIASGYLT